jgi:hypothetical protein
VIPHPFGERAVLKLMYAAPSVPPSAGAASALPSSNTVNSQQCATNLLTNSPPAMHRRLPHPNRICPAISGLDQSAVEKTVIVEESLAPRRPDLAPRESELQQAMGPGRNAARHVLAAATGADVLAAKDPEPKKIKIFARVGWPAKGVLAKRPAPA